MDGGLRLPMAIGADLNGRWWPGQPFKPRLKHPTQSQVVDGDTKVPDLKVCVQMQNSWLYTMAYIMLLTSCMPAQSSFPSHVY